MAENLSIVVETPELCWEACVAEYGEVIYAIDFYTDGDCYCSSDCSCLAGVGDEQQFLMTSEWLDELPHVCGSEEEESLFIRIQEEMYSSIFN